MNEGVKRIYSEMQNLFLKKPEYSEPNGSVLLVLENNILNRSIRTFDKIKNKISATKFEKLNKHEIYLLHYMFNTGEKMKMDKIANLIKKSPTHCRKLLKNLIENELVEWHGTSIKDPTQYYTIKF